MTDDQLSRLERLTELLKQGAINQTEFDEQKRAILGTATIESAPVTPKTAEPIPTEPQKVVVIDPPKKKSSLSLWLALGFVALIVFVALDGSNKGKKALSDVALDTLALSDTSTEVLTPASPAPVENWTYYSDSDKMGSSVKTASVDATELLQFDFPYNGGSTATFTIRKKGGSTDCYLRVSKGQFISRAGEDGSSRIRFDSGKPVTYSTSGAADYSSDIVFFNSTSSLISHIKKAKKMVTEIEFYSEGNRQIEFDIDDLKW